MTAYATTSVPAWAVSGGLSGSIRPDPSARTWLLLAVGEGAEALHAWAAQLPGDAGVTLVEGTTPDALRGPLADAIAAQRIGTRVLVAGPAGDCLVVRGQLLSAGFEDDEVVIVPTGTGTIEVYCCHCQQTTRSTAAIGELVPCAHCGVSLHVYHHVSRLTGRYLGFQMDAETLPKGFVA